MTPPPTPAEASDAAPGGPPGAGRMLVLASWIAARLLLAFYLGQRGVAFFYQNF